MSLKWWQIRINVKQFSSNLTVFIFLSRDDPIVFNHEALKNRKESFDVIRNIDHLWTGLWYYRYCCYFFFSLGMENSKISLGNERNGSWSYKGIRIFIYNFRFTLVFRVFQLEAHRKCNGAGKRKWDSQETTKRRKFLQSDWLTSSIMFSPCNAGESLKSRTSKLHRLLYFLANPMYQ